MHYYSSSLSKKNDSMSISSKANSFVSNNFPIDVRMSSGKSTDNENQQGKTSCEYKYNDDNNSESSVTSASHLVMNCTCQYKHFESKNKIIYM